MFGHILKLIWNRKRSNGLIITEVMICFIVAFAVLTMAIYNYRLYQEPLGFEWNNVWSLDIDTAGAWEDEKDREQVMLISKMLNQQPEIESANGIRLTPFIRSRWRNSTNVNGKEVYFMMNHMEARAPEMLKMNFVDGGSFSSEDRGLNVRPIIINKQLSETLFGAESAIGKTISNEDDLKNGAIPTKIVGVFDDFRQFGEFGDLGSYVIYQYDLAVGDKRPFTSFSIKINPETGVIYEETLLKLLKGVAPKWDFSIKSWSSLRDQSHREFMIPMTVFSTISLFLLMMVGLGLFGVLWQNVTRRTQEIGLRRAMGATNMSIHTQISGELLVVSLFGLIIGTLILVQIPLLGVIQQLDWLTFWLGHGAATILMFLLALICSFYPSKVATNYTPAMALHYE